jgi:hypothetical protein
MFTNQALPLKPTESKMQAKVQRSPSTNPKHIRGAMAVNAASMVVVRMIDGAKPQPPQTFKLADCLARVQKQKALAVPPA